MEQRTETNQHARLLELTGVTNKLCDRCGAYRRGSELTFVVVSSPESHFATLRPQMVIGSLLDRILSLPRNAEGAA
jgi:hypothetical protein